MIEIDLDLETRKKSQKYTSSVLNYEFSKYSVFAMCLDIVYMKHITKVVYAEKLKIL